VGRRNSLILLYDLLLKCSYLGKSVESFVIFATYVFSIS
jgi:hypothetical protein